MSKIQRYTLVILVMVFMTAFSGFSTQAAAPLGPPTIRIPSLKIKTAIKDFPLSGDTWHIGQWERGIGHLQGTGWFNNPGNVVLAGHSKLPNGKAGVFRRLSNLAVGSDILVFDGWNERRYQVIDKRVVSPYDLSVVYPTGDDRLTLITCEVSSYDPKSNSYGQRLVVIAQRVG
jgi:LPXTG-site transpeptidase (sortase) family protein